MVTKKAKAVEWPFPTRQADIKALKRAAPVNQAAEAAASPNNHKAAWTVEATNKLLVGYSLGFQPQQLAAYCGRTQNSVASRLHSLGVLSFDKVHMAYKTRPTVWFKVKA